MNYQDKQCVAHVGSVRFRSIIESYRTRYAASLTKFDKMQITKEIYETLSQTSRFLKYNTKENVWEEVRTVHSSFGGLCMCWLCLLLHPFLASSLQTPVSHCPSLTFSWTVCVASSQISPMAARDKCGHALRFANRNKSKGKNAVGMRLAPETAALVGLRVSVAPSLSSSTVSTSHSTSSTTATPTSHAPSPVPAAVTTSMPQLQQQQAAMVAAANQHSRNHHTTTGGAQAQQRELWGELLQRYDTMWSAARIPVVPGGGAATGNVTPPTTSTTTAPPSVVSIPTQNHDAAAASERQGDSAAASGRSGEAAAAAAAASFRGQLLNTMMQQHHQAEQQRQAVAAAAAEHHRRRSTLEDLCSILAEPSVRKILGGNQ